MKTHFFNNISKSLFFYFLFTISFSPLFATNIQNTINLGHTKSSFQYTPSINGKITKGKIVLASLQLEEIKTNNGNFTQISIPGFHKSKEEGFPQLPQINKIIEISGEEMPVINIIKMEETEIKLKNHGFLYPVYPVQASISKSSNNVVRALIQDTPVYSANKFYRPNSKITIEKLGQMRSKEFALLRISPISYNPVSGAIKIIHTIEFEIIESNKHSIKNSTYSQAFNHLYERILKREIYSDPAPAHKGIYLIISPEKYISALEPFIQWKKQMGYLVDLHRFEDLDTSNYAVKDFISEAYHTADINNLAPEYILLVGDHEDIPAFEGKTENHITDLPFAEVTDDYLPDMFIGRFPVNTVSQLQFILEKTMSYEKGKFSDANYLNNIMLIAGWDNSDYNFHLSHSAPTMEYGIQNYFNSDWGYSSVNYFLAEKSYTVNPMSIINTINSGVGFINYSGHGTVLSWYNPRVSDRDISSFTNQQAYPLVVTNGCNTSNFKINESLGERWICKDNGGAMAYIGATNSTYWDEDVFWATGNFDHVGDGKTITFNESGTGFYDIPFKETTEINQSALIYAGNMSVQESGSPLSNYYWETYELFGDPSLNNYWSEPNLLYAYFLKKITLGETQLSIKTSALTSVMAALSFEDSLIAYSSSDPSGNITLNFVRPLQQSGDYILVLSGRNYFPVIDTIEVICQSESNLTQEFIINQNYPNPFNPTTTISYKIPYSSDLQFTIYNLLGENILEKSINNHEPGWHHYIWNGTNNYNIKMPTGIYFFRINYSDASGNPKNKHIKLIYLK